MVSAKVKKKNRSRFARKCKVHCIYTNLVRRSFLAQVRKCACGKGFRATVQVCMRKSFLAEVWKCACGKAFRGSVQVRMRKSFLAEVCKCACGKGFRASVQVRMRKSFSGKCVSVFPKERRRIGGIGKCVALRRRFTAREPPHPRLFEILRVVNGRRGLHA